MARDFWGELQDLHSDLEEVILDGNHVALVFTNRPTMHGWEFKIDSPTAKILNDLYRLVYGKDPYDNEDDKGV